MTATSIGPGAGADQCDRGNSYDWPADHDLNLPRSYIARDEGGRIVGHLGLCRTTFEGQMTSVASGVVATMHVIDWLGSPSHRSIGISLMRRAQQGVVTQFGLGGHP